MRVSERAPVSRCDRPEHDLLTGREVRGRTRSIRTDRWPRIRKQSAGFPRDIVSRTLRLERILAHLRRSQGRRASLPRREDASEVWFRDVLDPIQSWLEHAFVSGRRILFKVAL